MMSCSRSSHVILEASSKHSLTKLRITTALSQRDIITVMGPLVYDKEALLHDGSYPRELSLVFHRRRIVFTLREVDEELQEYHVVARRCCEAAAPSFLALVQGVRVCNCARLHAYAPGGCFRVHGCLPGALLAAIAEWAVTTQ